MLKIVINGVYYDGQDGGVLNFNKGRWKKNSVYFFDYSDEIGFIIRSLSFSQFGKLRLSIYNSCHSLIKFERFGEENVNGDVFTGYKVSSDIIEITDDDFARIIPDRLIRKKYFQWDNIKEKYYLKGDFINYVRLNVKNL